MYKQHEEEEEEEEEEKRCERGATSPVWAKQEVR